MSETKRVRRVKVWTRAWGDSHGQFVSPQRQRLLDGDRHVRLVEVRPGEVVRWRASK